MEKEKHILKHAEPQTCWQLSSYVTWQTAQLQIRGIHTDPPSLEEVGKAIQKFRNGHSAGPDGIPSKLVKGALEPVNIGPHQLSLNIWASGKVSA